MNKILIAALALVASASFASAEVIGPRDCRSDDARTKPIVTPSSTGTETFVWPMNCGWISPEEGALAVQDDPAWGSGTGEGGEGSGE